MKKKVFRIAAPFAEINQICRLKEAGADELYCGYIDDESERLWPSCFCTINRRGKGDSLEGYRALKRASDEAAKLKLPVYLTMNGFYAKEQYPWVIKTIYKASSLPGIKGVIVADIGLLLYLKKAGYKKEIQISTLTGNLNHYTVDFFASLGAKRIILDRQLTTAEIKDILLKQKPGRELEIFVFDDSCFFIDGYCGFTHYFDNSQQEVKLSKKIHFTHSYCAVKSPRHGCGEIQALLRSSALRVHNTSSQANPVLPPAYQSNKYSFHCNLCGLFELKGFNNLTLKIVARGTDVSRAVKLVSDTAHALDSTNVSRINFCREVKKLYHKFYGFKCDGSGCSHFKLMERLS